MIRYFILLFLISCAHAKPQENTTARSCDWHVYKKYNNARWCRCITKLPNGDIIDQIDIDPYCRYNIEQ